MSWKREEVSVPGYEKVVYAEESASGLKAIVAIHNLALGPACGGIRLLPYASREEAQQDVLRLSKGMSYKSSLAGINFGGGKSVIIREPSKKNPDLFHAFGELVDSLGGSYLAAQDMNITSGDLREVKHSTRHVLGIEGEPGSSGDPSPMTARGVLRALEATVEKLTGSKRLSGIKVAVQGLGSVGYRLAEMAFDAGAELWVTDINPEAVKKAQQNLKAHVVEGDAIFDVACDVFSPNAKGAAIRPDTISRLKCKAVCGAANNQLATEADGMRLHERGILYAPDYAVNAGGIINIFVEFDGYTVAKAHEKTDRIYDTLKRIFERADKEKRPPFVIADRLAEERMNASH